MTTASTKARTQDLYHIPTDASSLGRRSRCGPNCILSVPAPRRTMNRRLTRNCPFLNSVEFLTPLREFAVTKVNTLGSNPHRPPPAPVTLSAHSITILGTHAAVYMQGGTCRKLSCS